MRRYLPRVRRVIRAGTGANAPARLPKSGPTGGRPACLRCGRVRFTLNGPGAARPRGGKETAMSLFERWGVSPVINATGSVTRLGGAPMPPAVLDAYRAAAA